jgi:hypothetical protein
VDHLTDGEAEQISGIAIASLLLYAVLLRYQTSVATPYDAWYQNLVQDRFADLSVPGVLGTLRSEYGDGWWHRVATSAIARGGAIGEELRIGDELRRRGEFSRRVRALPHETQEMYALADLRSAPNFCFLAEDARDRLLVPEESVLRGDGVGAQSDMEAVMNISAVQLPACRRRGPIPRKASVVHGFISPAAFSAWVMTACTSMRRVRGLVGSGASLTGSPAAPDVSAVARSWRGGAGTIEADSLRLVGTARGCPVRPQNFAM